MKIETGELTGEHHPHLTDYQVTVLAKKMYTGEIFTSMQIPKHSKNLITSVFMPLIFLDTIQIKQMELDDITDCYADMSDAGPRSINGLPIFMSLCLLRSTDAEKIINKYYEIKEKMDSIT